VSAKKTLEHLEDRKVGVRPREPLGASAARDTRRSSAQGELGDVVYVELPSVGTKLGKHDVFGTIEAVKAVSELFSPLAGEVVEINGRLDGEPALVNSDPYGAGWMIRIKPDDAGAVDSLMDAAGYSKHLG